MRINIPTWAIPVETMTDEELRFAIEAVDVIDFMQREFTRQDHIDCYDEVHQPQAGRDWDEVVRRLAEEKK